MTMTTRERAKDLRLRREYHITLAEYNVVLAFQNGKCYICGFKPTSKQNGLAVDHEHEGKCRVRGLLCWTCNKLIAMLRDDPQRATNAANYLNFHPFWVVFGREFVTAGGRVGTKARKKKLAAFNLAAGKGDEAKTKKGRKSRKSSKV